jgi:ATP-dependent DNA ligase
VDGQRIARIAVVPVTEDPTHLYGTWVGMGGESIMLKDAASPYRPGECSAAWLKVNSRQCEELRTSSAVISARFYHLECRHYCGAHIGHRCCRCRVKEGHR